MAIEPHKEMRRLRRLETAWKRVRDNARKSRSKRTRSEIEAFGSDIHHNLRSIQGQLVADSFKFEPSRGWAEPPKDPGKAHRPIVITPVASRIVQRSILDALLEEPGIQDFIDQPYSFGGIQKKDPEATAAVPGAIQAAVNSILLGNQYFIRSDISGFFRKIPKADVMAKIRSCISDDKFCKLIEESIAVELVNLKELRQHASLFPLEDIGVAQGCALSPLFGIILLSNFDKELNAGSCTCIRYMDDFLILGPSEETVDATFSRALDILGEFDMEAYDPAQRPEKAERGNVYSEGLEFLGVELKNGSIRPSPKNRGNLIQSINEAIQDHTKRIPSDSKNSDWSYNHSYLKCLLERFLITRGHSRQQKSSSGILLA